MLPGGFKTLYIIIEERRLLIRLVKVSVGVIEPYRKYYGGFLNGLGM